MSDYEELIRGGINSDNISDLVSECIEQVLPFIRHLCDPAVIGCMPGGPWNTHMDEMLRLLTELRVALVNSDMGKNVAAHEYEQQQIDDANSCHMDVDQINDDIALEAA